LSLRELFLLDPDVAFLNHGSFGACPRPVFEEYRRLQLELERQPVDFLARDRRFPELIEAAKARLANYVGADPGTSSSLPRCELRGYVARIGGRVALPRRRHPLLEPSVLVQVVAPRALGLPAEEAPRLRAVDRRSVQAPERPNLHLRRRVMATDDLLE
jgi:hypothetical protein